MQNEKSWYKIEIARPDMALQNFNPWSLIFDHVLFDVSQVAITTINFALRTVRTRRP